MTVNADVFKAILAMDSYNRGYDAGINFGASSDAPGTQIGNATISTNSTLKLGEGVDSASSFYAVAYQLADGSRIISYRGTDNYLLDSGHGCVLRSGRSDHDAPVDGRIDPKHALALLEAA